MENNIKLKKSYLFFILILSFTSCATYQVKTSELQSNIFDGNVNLASSSIEKNAFLLQERNKLLYLLEKGKIEHLKGNYESSNNYFEQAYILVDDKINTNVGQAIASKLTNPMAEPYKGEDFEKVLIHYYKALNYFQLGQKQEAIVEAKRINIKLLKLNENYKENKNTYSQDAFSQIVLGILFESTNQINDAFIAYRNAEEIYHSNKGSFFGVQMPEQLKVDLQRTAKEIGFTKDYNDYVQKYGKKEFSTKITDEAIVFWENGKGPAKDQIKLTASGAGGAFVGTYDDDMSSIIIPIPANVNLGINAIAIPKYVKRESYYKSASLLVNNQEQKFELCQDFYPIAKQCLRDRMMREVVNIAVRYGAKKAVSTGLGLLGDHFLPNYAKGLTGLAVDGVNAATEKADTRNWQTLSATISYIRVPVTNGENKFVFKKFSETGVDIDTLKINYKKGLQIVNWTDYGKSIPKNNSVSNLALNTNDIDTTQQKQVVANSPVNSKEIFKNTQIETEIKAETTSVETKKQNENTNSSKFAMNNGEFNGVLDIGIITNNLSDYVLPPIVVTGDAFLSKNIGCQIYGLTSLSSFEGGSVKYDISNFSFGARGNYFFNTLLKLDPEKIHVFAGVTVGYAMIETSITSSSPYIDNTSTSSGDIFYFAQIGSRYFFSKRFGIKGELQLAEGGTNIMIGLSYKIPRKK